MEAMIRGIDASGEACRSECGYFLACGGGAPVNKLSEQGIPISRLPADFSGHLLLAQVSARPGVLLAIMSGWRI